VNGNLGRLSSLKVWPQKGARGTEKVGKLTFRAFDSFEHFRG